MTLAAASVLSRSYPAPVTGGAYNFDVPNFGESDIVVEFLDAGGAVVATLAPVSDFTLTPAGLSRTASTVTILRAVPGTVASLRVRRATRRIQPETAPPDAVALEIALDRAMMALQEVAQDLARGLRVPELTGIGQLPGAATRAGKILQFDSLGAPTVGNVPFIGTSAASFDSRLAVQGITVAAPATFITTAGYDAPGDGGGGLYRRVATEPTHALKVRDASGAWFELVPVNGQINILQAGAKPDDATDSYQAIVDCLTAFRTAAGALFLGPEVLVPVGSFFVSQTLNIKGTVRLVGVGGFMAEARASRLRWPVGVPGIIVHSANTLGNGTVTATTTAIGSTFIGLHLEGGGRNTTPADGLLMRARAEVLDCSFRFWGRNGIRIAASAGTGGATEGNANGFGVYNTNVRECGADGIFVDGADANAGVFVNVNSNRNNGAGFNDSSFLGNAYVGCQTALNGALSQVSHLGNRYFVTHFEFGSTPPGNPSTEAPGTGAAWTLLGAGGADGQFPAWVSGNTYMQGGGFLADNPSARSTWVGCYMEGNEPPSFAAQNTVIVGGLRGNAVRGGGMVVGDGEIRGGEGVSFPARADDTLPGMDVNLRPRADFALEVLVNGDHPRGIALQWIDAVKAWAWTHAGSAGLAAIQLTTTLSTLLAGRTNPVGGGFAHFGRGLFVGTGTSARMITHGFTAPPTSGEWGRGDFVFNRNPARGGVLGWTNVSTTATPDWVAIPVPT